MENYVVNPTSILLGEPQPQLCSLYGKPGSPREDEQGLSICEVSMSFVILSFFMNNSFFSLISSSDEGTGWKDMMVQVRVSSNS